MQAIRVNSQINWVSQAAIPVRMIALVICLLLSQALGFMHGIEHAAHPQPQHDHQDNHHFQKQVEAKNSSAHAGWIADLFAGHSEESTCQVFDQLSQGNALLGQAVEIAQLTATSFFLDTYQGATPAYRRSLVQARGPPAASTLV